MDLGEELLRVAKWVGISVVLMGLPIVAYGVWMQYRWKHPRLSAAWWRAQRRVGK